MVTKSKTISETLTPETLNKTFSFGKHFLYLLFVFGVPRPAFSLAGILRLTRFFGGFVFFAGTLSAEQVKTYM